MSTVQHPAIKELTGGTRPYVSAKRVNKDQVQKYLENRAKAPEADADGGAPTDSAQKHHTAKQQSELRTFIQNPVGNSSQFPYSAIGICVAQYDNNSFYCTGTLVGSNAVLTMAGLIPAEHWDANDWSMQFIPAYNNGRAPFGVINVLEAHGYKPTGLASDDYMVCHLDTPVGNTTGGWFNIFASSDTGFYRDITGSHSVGYPSGSIQIEATHFLVNKADSYDNGGSIIAWTDAFQDGGWSGGPLWYGPVPFIYAIATGTNTVETGGPQANSGGTDMENLVFYAQDHWL